MNPILKVVFINLYDCKEKFFFNLLKNFVSDLSWRESRWLSSFYWAPLPCKMLRQNLDPASKVKCLAAKIYLTPSIRVQVNSLPLTDTFKNLKKDGWKMIFSLEDFEPMLWIKKSFWIFFPEGNIFGSVEANSQIADENEEDSPETLGAQVRLWSTWLLFLLYLAFFFSIDVFVTLNQ